MTKKKLKEVIDKAVLKAGGITTQDSTIVRENPYTSICIWWHGSTNRSTIEIVRGRSNDPKVIDGVRKYKKWLLELGIV